MRWLIALTIALAFIDWTSAQIVDRAYSPTEVRVGLRKVGCGGCACVQCECVDCTCTPLEVQTSATPQISKTVDRPTQSVVVHRTVSAAGSPAFAEVNRIRASRGLQPFIYEPRFQSTADRKAQIQASRGRMYHPGGSMGGARYEGVGMGNQFLTCYLNSRGPFRAAAATRVGRNGRRYHCLLISPAGAGAQPVVKGGGSTRRVFRRRGG